MINQMKAMAVVQLFYYAVHLVIVIFEPVNETLNGDHSNGLY